MKVNIFIGLIFVMVNCSCAEKKYIKEVISDKKVSIIMRETYNDKYLVLLIPLELELNLNSEEIFSIVDYYEKNNSLMELGEDYIYTDKADNKVVLGFDRFKTYNYPKNIYLIERKNKITKQQALELIKKYNPNASLDKVKTKYDTIPLVSYKQYRIDNPKLLEEMRKVPDSLTLSISIKGKKENILSKLKINW
ncbi:hypothetical protein WFZ85_12405 [Flavobacterium sp. j3]|uniref:DUF4252 domain-containing protein n=1 Tax=Flavobacterium aureirubrum TaxID=3133147 RepID=A0ABU9N6U0_9FLAO